MRLVKFGVVVGLSLAATACANVKKAPVENKLEGKKQLEPRVLSPGECGLFVWSASQEKRFVLFAQLQKGTAVWYSDGAERSLVITAKGGMATEGQNPRLVFGDTGLDLSLRDKQPITDGTRYKAGTLTLKSDDEWDRVMPVVGLSACQPL